MARRIMLTLSGEQEDAIAAHILKESCTVLDTGSVLSTVESVKEREKEIEIPSFMFERRCAKKMAKKMEKRRAKRARKWKSA